MAPAPQTRHVLAQRNLRMPSERAFACLADPEFLDRLVPMRVERVRPGSGPGGNGVGSVRQVSLHGLLPMAETIVEVTPPEVIRYRISPHGPIRAYEGVQRFASTPTGSSVC